MPCIDVGYDVRERISLIKTSLLNIVLLVMMDVCDTVELCDAWRAIRSVGTRTHAVSEVDGPTLIAWSGYVHF